MFYIVIVVLIMMSWVYLVIVEGTTEYNTVVVLCSLD